MEMVLDSMREPCYILARKKYGDWLEYSYERKEWVNITGSLDELLDNVSGIINWGNYILSDEHITVNFSSSVSIASNKARSRRILQERGIAVPRSYFWDNLADCVEVNYPIIVRPSHHLGGKNFHVFKEPKALQAFLWGKQMGTWYASEIFPKTHEFRVHCAHGRILMISSKPLVEGEIRANHSITEEAWPAVPRKEWNSKVCEESLKAIESLSLDYGAVDIMYNSENDSVAICEINTAPSICTPYSSGKYAMYFDWLIRNDFPEHYPIKPNYVFYNDWLRK